MFGYVPPVERLRVAAPPPGVAAAARRALVTGTTAAPRRSARGLVLDLDDTLYPRERFVRSGFAAVARHVETRFGIPAGAAFTALTRALDGGQDGREFQALCRRFGLPAGTTGELVDVFRAHTPTLWLSHDVTATLARLRADNWGLVVLTNGLPSVQFRKVAALALSQIVDDVIYAEEHATGGKPAEAAFRAALRALDVPIQQAVCVGDDLVRDVRGARAVGLRTIRLARPGVTARPGEDADLVLDAFSELPAAAALLLSQVTAHVA